MPNDNPLNGAAENQSPPNRLIRVLTILYVVLPVTLMYLLFIIFPQFPWPSGAPNPPVKFLIQSLTFHPSLDERLLLVVIFAGALGSFLHAATSFSSYVGNQQFSGSWGLWYVLRPLIGSALAVILYFATRGGLGLMLGANNTAEVVGSDALNPYGVGAIAGLSGMFSKQASDKLAEVFNTFFKSSGDDERKDSLKAPSPSITDVDPSEGPVAGGTRITISGTGFAVDAKVTIGGALATNVEVVDDATIMVDTPAHTAGAVDVEVVNADGRKASNTAGFTYV